MKKFIITIDTEGDNLWMWDKSSPILTENTLYLSRFQKLCERFGFKPVWLTNYEMINDPRYIDFIMDVEERGVGELGMHLHAWNTPPMHSLPVVQTGLPYLIEYPDEIMKKKVEYLTNLIEEKTGIRPTSHRAGRWAMDERYFNILMECGYNVDCSVTPHQNWQTSPGQTEVDGTDYSAYPEEPYWKGGNQSLLEVPVSIRASHNFILPDRMSLRGFARSLRDSYKGYNHWLRPDGRNERRMLRFLDLIYESKSDYIMFMLHSSELMPGGSPTFKTQESIESLYKTLEKVFSRASLLYEGITLREYYKTKKR